MSEMQGQRWKGRPVLGRLVLIASWLVPVAAGVGAATAVSRLMPRPPGFALMTLWWALVIAASTLAVVVTDRLSRRLLPLATLLKLTMVFPDKAPTRYRVARRAIRSEDLETQLEEARQAGADTDRGRAAEHILALATALNSHDRRTRGHSERVRVYADLLAAEMDLSTSDRDRLRWAALLHDVGKLTVPEDVLNKAGKPTDDEWSILQRHPEEGAKLAAGIVPWLGKWAQAIEHHHERWDGTGYPKQLKGKKISLGGRIVAVADSYEVMTAARPYKKPLSAEAAREQLTAAAGSQFDPGVVRAFMSVAIGKLRRTAGPAAWLGQLPFTWQVQQVARPVIDGLGRVGGQIANVGQAVGAGLAGTALVVGTTLAAPSLTNTDATGPRSEQGVSAPRQGLQGPDTNLGPAPETTDEQDALDDDPATADAPAGSEPGTSGPAPQPGTAPSPGGGAADPAPITTPPPPPSNRYLAVQSLGTKRLRMFAEAPGAMELPDHDKPLTGDPGFTLTHGSEESWDGPVEGTTHLNGQVRLHLWSALPDFATGSRGAVHLTLDTCSGRNDSKCEAVASGGLDLADWSKGHDGWVEHVVHLSPVQLTLPEGSWLKLRVAVDGSSSDLWLAFGTADYPSRIVLPL